MIICALFLFIATNSVISSAEVTNDDLKKLAEANNNVAESLYPRLIEGNLKNVLFGPLSLLTGLGIILYGARGNTQQELYSVLGYKDAGLQMDRIPPTILYYLTQLLPQNNASVESFTLYAADEVLVTNEAPLNPQFQEEAQKLYLSPVENVDVSKRNDVANSVNNFVSQQTHGKINRIINSLDTSPSIMLIDAVFFQGKWETPFPPQYTAPQPFYSPKGEKNVPFMQVIHSFPYLENRDFQAVLLPYIGGNVGLLILMPRLTYGLSNLEAEWTPKRIVNLLHLLQPQKTLVLLPKFEFQYYRDFSNDLKAMGAKSVYDGSGDFSGMTNSHGLSVSYTLVKQALEVDESNQGAGMTVDFTPPIPSTVLANRPFMFAVVDTRINLLVFVGHVVE